MFVGGTAFSVTRISPCAWGISITFGFLSILVGTLIRTIPNGPIHNLLIRAHVMRDPNALPIVDPATEAYSQATSEVHDNSNTFTNFRGGRSSSVRVPKHRSTHPRQTGIQNPSALGMASAPISGGVGTRRQQVAPDDSSKNSVDMWAGKLQLHPSTNRDDPAYQRWGRQLEKRQGSRGSRTG